MEGDGKNWSAGTGWSKRRGDGCKTFLLPAGPVMRSLRQGLTPPITGSPVPQSPSGSVLCSALLDHGHNDDRESERGIERLSVVTRYLLPAPCPPLVSPLFFEWAEFDARLEHIASTDLLQSVISEQPLPA